MMGIGFPELMIILVIIMIIFGAGKLPEIGSAFGNSIKNFKKSKNFQKFSILGILQILPIFAAQATPRSVTIKAPTCSRTRRVG